MAKTIVNAGDVFGKLTVIAEIEPSRRLDNGKIIRKVRCRCSCDQQTIKDFILAKLVSGHTTSCGCVKRAWLGNHTRTHGRQPRALYFVWKLMKQRCYDEHSPAYKHYGGRGICICQEWQNNFVAFRDWALTNGWQNNLEIDRIHNDDPCGYCPDNCRFVTRTINMRNTRTNRLLTAFGQTRCVAEWVEVTGISSATIIGRLNRGWSNEKAVTSPVRSWSKRNKEARK